ncbi:lipopolysaccharide biosynthesis protein [Echinicola sp. CAU 1574]|uniref:Lipopolysaccharide biosynthesis protein n=1 Tax=Echinicola arenosa TaxID=2774144 RepID=A0ABR9ANG1_9BACT|nr:lipopolysaccharide biosynthesis protein [Echinicola arenosa]MBD8490089.1 lipopolysaccharide biosynthesis protein [Echinicola arenosa]
MDSKKIISGIKWTSIQFVLDTGFKFTIKLILAKLLIPEEFGLIGMCSIFIAVATAASEMGMTSALIQKKDNNLAEKMYPTAFWTGLLWGAVLFIFMSFIVAPFASDFFEEEKLNYLVPFLSIGIILRPLSIVHVVILTRQMNFKVIARTTNFATLVSGIIAIILGYYGSGVWALVVNNILVPLLTIPLLFKATKWLPTKTWHKEHFKEIFSFGAYSSSTGMFSTLTYNIDNMLIGKMLGAGYLGSYTLAFSLTEQLRQMVSSVMNKVMYPVYGKNQDNTEKLKHYFLTVVNLNCIILFPVFMFLIIFSSDIVLFFGPEWKNANLPLKILSLAMIIHLTVNSFTSILRGMGKPKLEMKIILGLTIIVLIPGLIIGIKLFGLLGAALAVLINKIGLMITGLVFLNKYINLSINQLFKVLYKSVLGVTVSSSIIYFGKEIGGVENIPVLMSIYFFISYIIIFQLEKDKINKIIKISF